MNAKQFSEIAGRAREMAEAVKPANDQEPMYQSRTLIEYHLKQAARISREVSEQLVKKEEQNAIPNES